MSNPVSPDQRSAAIKNVADALKHLARLTPPANRAPQCATTKAGTCFLRVTRILQGSARARLESLVRGAA